MPARVLLQSVRHALDDILLKLAVQVVDILYSLASLPEHHLSPCTKDWVARGEPRLGITTWLPTRPGSIMKPIFVVGSSYLINPHYMHPIHLPAIKKVPRSRASRVALSKRYTPSFVLLYVHN